MWDMIAAPGELSNAGSTNMVRSGDSGPMSPLASGKLLRDTFESLLDDCLGVDPDAGSSVSPSPSQRTFAPQPARQRDDLAAPANVQVPVAAYLLPLSALPTREMASSEDDDEAAVERNASSAEATRQTLADAAALWSTQHVEGNATAPLAELAFAARLRPIMESAPTLKSISEPATLAPHVNLPSNSLSTNTPAVDLAGAKVASGNTGKPVAAQEDGSGTGSGDKTSADSGDQNTTGGDTATGSDSDQAGQLQSFRALAAATVEHTANAAQNTPQTPVDATAPGNVAVPPTQQGSTPSQPASANHPVEAEPPVPLPQPAASHGVSLRLGDGDSSVEIRMAERAGEIKVTVHTPDQDLANSLRNELPDLVGRLRQNGFQAETWRPQAPNEAASGRRAASEGSQSQDQSQHGRKGGRQPQQERRQNQSHWEGEWQCSLDPAQEQTL
jgi:hypothetical protein